MKRREKREQKREAAEERNAAWRGLSPADQLKILHRRPGKSRKQVARIKKGVKNG